MIYYHQTIDQIIFFVDEVASKEISEWNRNTQLTPRQLASLQAAGNPIPEYSLKLTLVESEVILEVARDTVGRATVDRFRKIFEARYQETSLMNETVSFLDALDKAKAFVLMIDLEHHKNLVNFWRNHCGLYRHDMDLKDWNGWVDSEAFSGRYIYEFFYPGRTEFLSRGRDTSIIDTQRFEEFILYPWDDIYDGPLAD